MVRRSGSRQAVQLTVEAFERAVVAEPEKLFVFVETAAQHFRGAGRTGAYEDRAETQHQPRANGTMATCFCGPTDFSEDWRNALLHEGLQEHARSRRIRLLPYFNLTRPRWDMHVAEATQQHGSSDGSPRRVVCDCTHFCYSPFLYEPLWWAIGQAADQMAPRPVETAA